jgi:uncharacterized coiled-coil DUF342 family protein
MPKITVEQLEGKVKRQDLQIHNLKVAISRIQQYAMSLEKKIARSAEMSRLNHEAMIKVMRRLDNHSEKLNDYGDDA